MKPLYIDKRLVDTIVICKECGYEMLAIDVAIVDGKACCPICKGKVKKRHGESPDPGMGHRKRKVVRHRIKAW